ncbi:MAG: LemA domain-containing protein [Verrucomicrobia bacterium]|nr:MAG: LemA domain-containing protein [Verrucomicrobiota bacterium]
MSPQAATWLPVAGGVLALLCLWAAMRANRRKRLIDNLPTSKTTGVFIGLVELKGTAESEAPLTSFLAGIPCVFHQWRVEEHWSRTVTETYTDAQGKTRTRTRRESGWTTVASGGGLQPFYLKDDCGVILVRPEGARIEAERVFDRTVGRSDPLYYGKGPARAVAHSDHRRRFIEEAIPLHARLYVMGRARERQDVVAPEIAADKEAPVFLISTREEKAISRGMAWRYWGWLIFGALLAAGGTVGRDLVLNIDPWRHWYWHALPYPLAALGGWVWMVYNSLVDLRQRVARAWAHIDVQLKRRHDLIPNLVRAVEAMRTHEREVQEALALLRNQLRATPPGEEGPEYEGCARRLIALREAYPDLKSNEAFGRLQEALTQTEQRIALARGYYNEIVTAWNTRLERVPDRWVAALAGMRPRPWLEAADFQRAPVEVKLAD